MADKLTPQQAQAVENRGGTLLVSAAAGSGKTKVLVDRLLSYLTQAEDPANLEEFLIITYTKAAASELRGKIAARLTQRIAQEPENRHLQKQMQRLFLTKISTIHGFCGDLLREYAYRLDIPVDFRVADEKECAELRQDVLRQLMEGAYEEPQGQEDFYAFLDTQGLGRDDRLIPELIAQVYDSSRCHLDPEQWLDQCLAWAQGSGVRDAGETVWGRFLIDSLHDYLDCHISVLTACAHALDRGVGMEKPAAVIRDILVQLHNLREVDTWDAVRICRDIDYGRLTFPRKNVDGELAQRVKTARAACKKGLERRLRAFYDPSGQVLSDLDQASSGIRGLCSLVRRFAGLYAAAKRSRRVLDFSDLEQKTLDLLLGKKRSGPTAVAREIARRFREVLVDEYQDSNGVQDAIFSALTAQRNNCFLVGDVKQSIYQFRLADPGIFLEKYNRFAPADQAQPGQGRKVLLSHNFRSGPEIIEGVNAVFTACMRPHVGGLVYAEAERLREGVAHVPLGEPGMELFALETREDTYGEEAAFVAEQIQTMLRQGRRVRKNGELVPVEPEDIVILLRSPGSAAGYFQEALERRGIRCASGSGGDLLQTQEVSAMRAFLQTILNPRQDIPLIAALTSPIFGFTADELARIRGKRKSGSVYDAVADSELPKARRFVEILTRLRIEARMNTLTGLLEQCFSLTRLDSVYAAMEGGQARSANLQAFFQLAVEYENGGLRDLSQFISYLDTLAEKGLTSAASGQGCVQIMSIHKSKGLEFPVVFLCNLSRGFNKESLRGQILCHRELGLGLSAVDNANRIRYPTIAKRAIAVRLEDDSLSEELRVLYVAMTRARDRLIMTYASRSLSKELQEIALRMDFDGGELVCRDAGCMGDWILLTALKRTEAGQLHALGARPVQTELSDTPWNIQVCQAPPVQTDAAASCGRMAAMPENAEEILRRALAFQYPYMPATCAPSKQTATQRKGREKDAEAAQDAQEPRAVKRQWRQPQFRQSGPEATAYGTAMHLAMQYLRYENCGSLPGVTREIQRLVEEGFLTGEQGSLVDCREIARFFETSLGNKLVNGVKCLREFKFSILDDGEAYAAGLEGEQILLQGVVDCALLEDDHITVLDFKTDRVTEKTLEATAAAYAPQVLAYKDALQRIYEKPVRKAYLYFFRLGKYAAV